MIVELVGLPGSGKSTFARRLESEFGFVRIAVRGPIEILAYNAVFLVRHPIRYVRLLVWTLAHLGPSGFRYEKFVNCFLVHNAKFEKARRFPRAVIDQGHHQNIVSLFDHALAPGDLERYRMLCPQPDLLIAFDLSKELRERGMEDRGYGTREAMEGSARAAWLAAAEKNFSALADRISAGALPYSALRLDDTSREHENADRIFLRITRPIVRYVMNVRMPTEKAHGVQIYRSLEALSRIGVFAELWLPKRKNPITESLDAYYATANGDSIDAPRLAIRYFRIPDAVALLGWAGSIAHWTSEALFAFALLSTRTDRTAISYTRSALAARMLVAKGCRVVYEAHVWPASRTQIFSWLIHGVELIVANSEGTAEAFRKAGFSNVCVAQNGVLLQDESTALDPKRAREKVGLPEKPTVLYLGAFYRWKGAPFLVDAWAKHFSARDDLSLVMVGGDIETLIREGASSSVRDARGVRIVPHQPVRMVPAYLAAADVLVVPLVPETEEARTYTSPIKLFEYLASGRPVIAADLPSIRNTLADGMATFFPAGDADALADRIRDAFTPEGRDRARRQLSLIAESGIVAAHTWEARMRGILKRLDVAI